MDFALHVEQQLQHLVAMAKLPGMKAHAWLRANELKASHPMYADLPQRLTEAMRSAPSPSAPSTA